MNRLTLTETPQQTLTIMAEGNPGALTVLIDLLKREAAIDPDSGLAPYGTILDMDALGIYGSAIWVLWKDVCGQSTPNLVTLFRASQLGLFERATLPRLDHTSRIDFAALLKQVQERLPAFGVAPLRA